MSRALFNRSSTWVKERFGGRVQKIPVDAGFSCPNLDGTLSKQGCLYCNNRSFSPFYSSAQLSISEQLHKGRAYFAGRYGCQKFFAYFQSYSCTYAPVKTLREKYQEAANSEGIIGLVIATRPDCISTEIVELLKEFAGKTFIRVELGVESCDDEVLSSINRCHNVATALNSVKLLSSAAIPVSIHLISGLPGEQPDHMARAARIVSESGADMVKLHHLQIVNGSRLAELYKLHPENYRLYTLEDYLDKVCEFIASLSPKIYLDRFIGRVPLNQLLAPVFKGIDEAEFQRRLESRLRKLNLEQGAEYAATA
ncbi:MAG: TIGR01212 family radical SAM protein [Candidatus Riflebacteria bacterium HGW-Riflebacteria-1]|nr:MAG: TIGR01212 family radical SAM protein [Candidatus Riflebacteria bacterium HGW-Riflebacteria-1]